MPLPVTPLAPEKSDLNDIAHSLDLLVSVMDEKVGAAVASLNSAVLEDPAQSVQSQRLSAVAQRALGVAELRNVSLLNQAAVNVLVARANCMVTSQQLRRRANSQNREN